MMEQRAPGLRKSGKSASEIGAEAAAAAASYWTGSKSRPESRMPLSAGTIT